MFGEKKTVAGYYGARYYDQEIGRFTQADTIVPRPLDGQTFIAQPVCEALPVPGLPALQPNDFYPNTLALGIFGDLLLGPIESLTAPSAKALP